LVADDHQVVREGLGQAIEADARLRLVGAATDGDEALEMVEALRPDVLLLDIFMPRLGGDQVLQALHGNESPVKVMVLTAGPTPELHDVLRHRPDSLIYKSAPSETICDQIVTLVRGEDWSFGRVNLERALALASARVRLNQREQTVLELTAAGLKLNEIGERLSVSKSVVGTHLQGIREKLEVGTTAAAVARAYEVGLLSRRFWS
jgi:DNA-binding NarL/FixJ family response regulator